MTEPMLGILVLRTSRMEATLAFYRAFGLSFTEEKHGSGPVHYSCRLGMAVLEIYPAEAQEPGDYRKSGATLLGFNVASLDEVTNALRAMGIQILTEPKTTRWGRRAVMLDPDGRAVELNEMAEPALRSGLYTREVPEEGR